MASIEIETIKHMSWFSNLKAYYRFESGALTTDSSGQGNTLTAISDPAEAVGVFGGGVVFDADDAYSRDDDADFKPTGVFSVGCWFKAITISTVLFQSYSANTNLAGWRLRISSSGTLQLYSGKNSGTTSGTDWNAVATSSAANDGNWHFVVATWDGSNINISLDGGAFASAAWTYAPAYAATNYVRIGCANETGTNRTFSQATMDEVFILNGTALSASQIKAIYAGYILNTAVGSFILTGINNSYIFSVLTSTGAFTLTLKTVSSLLKMVASAGSFALTGNAISSIFKMVASAGSFALTGINASLIKHYKIIAGVGSFVLTGISNSFILKVLFEKGEFVLTGIDVAFQRTYTLIAEKGTFILTGIDIAFRRTYTLLASAGSFILTGIDATLKRGYRLMTETGIFNLAFKTIRILVNGSTTIWGKGTKPTTVWSSGSKPTTIWTNINKP